MRRTVNSHIQDLWDAGGAFIGDNGAPHGRVTVELDWMLRTSGTLNNVGSYRKGPIRWFQDAANDQTETEVPNVKSIDISRSIDTDTASCTIVISNTKMLSNGTENAGDGELGQPGYYTFNRGCSPDAGTRWGQTVNEWHDVLVPNALLRTYQGYGGKGKTINQAETDGNIIQTGLWLVDEVNPQANGTLQLRCRDMGKLLVDQSCYPPLIPANQTLFYYRFKDNNHPSIPYGTVTYGAGYTGVPAGQTSTEAPSVALDAHSSFASGHGGADAIDFGDTDSYWLSAGHATGDTNADMEYIQFKPAIGSVMDMGAYDLWTWGGGYEIYVSVEVGGVWQGTNTIPYTGSYPGMAIKYVQRIGTSGWEQPFLKGLEGGPYLDAQRIRFTFANLVRSSIGPQYFRAGVRDVSVGVMTTTVSGGGRAILGMARDSTANNDGYWLCGTDGGVFSFGDARYYGSLAGTPLAAEITGIAFKDHNSGYWLCGADGGVFSYGAAKFYGSIPSIGVTIVAPIAAIERSEGNIGYYMVTGNGAVYAFGDAHFAGNGSFGSNFCTAMSVRNQGGYWLVDIEGNVDAFGGAPYHGGAAAFSTAAITGICGTSTGNGYWVCGGDGAVYAFGDAVYYGGLTSFTLNDPITDIQAFNDDSGYWMVGADGGVFTFPLGSAGGENFWGSLPQAFDVEVAGNYTDWLDIIKDLLLWSGWWLHDTIAADEFPPIFGNLESTGAFALDNLTEDFFDKKPVIDVIHTIKEIVGYLAYVGDVGEFHFHPFNIWTIGNYFDDDGSHTTAFASIDEAIQMTDYQTITSDTDARSEIIISSDDPQAGFTDTVTTTRESTWGQAMLKGIVRNALWVNAAFITPIEQEIMAELVDLYLFMAQRQGNVTCAANPTIQINDQVRIWERQTAETYMHYVSGIETTQDLETGEYTMTLTSHWLGDGSAWFLAYE